MRGCAALRFAQLCFAWSVAALHCYAALARAGNLIPCHFFGFRKTIAEFMDFLNKEDNY